LVVNNKTSLVITQPAFRIQVAIATAFFHQRTSRTAETTTEEDLFGALRQLDDVIDVAREVESRIVGKVRSLNRTPVQRQFYTLVLDVTGIDVLL